MPDVYRTLLAVAGAEPPDHVLDGYDLMPFLVGDAQESPRKEYFYFLERLEAVRIGDWKLRAVDGEVELFNLRLDPGERINRATEEPGIVGGLLNRMELMANDVNIELAR